MSIRPGTRGAFHFIAKCMNRFKEIGFVISPIDVRVLFFAMDEDPAPALAEMAARRGWPFVRADSATRAIGEVRRHHPSAVVVQVTLQLDEELELLYRVRSGFSRTALIAVATRHYEEIERAVRSAGVHLYLPNAHDADQVERTVDQVLGRHKDASPAVSTANRAGASIEKALFPSASFPPSP